MIRTILKMGDPRLMRVAAPVQTFNSPLLDELVQDMFDTMHEAGGIGLAAPQIGEDLQLVVFGYSADENTEVSRTVPRTILCNPVITPLTDELEAGWEGCLSVPGMRGEVPRYQRIRYQGKTPQGEIIDRVVDGFHARVVQHECDHLTGMLYPSRIVDFSKFGFTDALFPLTQEQAEGEV